MIEAGEPALWRVLGWRRYPFAPVGMYRQTIRALMTSNAYGAPTMERRSGQRDMLSSNLAGKFLVLEWFKSAGLHQFLAGRVSAVRAVGVNDAHDPIAARPQLFQQPGDGFRCLRLNVVQKDDALMQPFEPKKYPSDYLVR